jgi:hypothetical protein
MGAICSAIRSSRPSHPIVVQAFPAVAHVAVGGLVFGQFLRDRPFSIGLALGGVAVWVAFVTWAVVLAGGKR